MNQSLTPTEMQKAMQNPADVFHEPEDVVRADLSVARKIEILRRWEYDARQIEVAGEEAMKPERDSDLLERVLRAMHQLGASPELTRTPPTKQGGV